MLCVGPHCGCQELLNNSSPGTDRYFGIAAQISVSIVRLLNTVHVTRGLSTLKIKFHFNVWILKVITNSINFQPVGGSSSVYFECYFLCDCDSLARQFPCNCEDISKSGHSLTHYLNFTKRYCDSPRRGKPTIIIPLSIQF